MNLKNLEWIQVSAIDRTRLEEIGKIAVISSREGLSKWARVVAAQARKNAPEGDPADRAWKTDQGKGSPRLKSSISMRTGKSKLIDGLFSGSVFTTDGTGALIEFGTGTFHQPHAGPCRAVHGPIVARKGGFMVFRARSGGIVRMRSVRGAKAQPFLIPAVMATLNDAPKYLTEELK